MHILLLSDNFSPETNAPANRGFEHAKAWVAAGHRVTVITCAPNFPQGKVYDGYRNSLWQTENMDGIEVIRVWSYMTRNEGFARRILDFVSYMVTGFIASFFVRRIDVIVGTSPQFFTACAAWAVSLFRRRPWVFELRDIWPESIRAVSGMQNSRVLDLLEKLELFLYRSADAIVAVTPSFKRNLIDRGIDGAKISVATNGVDLSRFARVPRDEALEASLKLQGKFVAGYIGTHGMAHHLETLVDAAEMLEQHPEGGDIRFLLVGDGASKSAIEQRARECGLANMIFVDPVSREEVARYWSLLDASIVHLKDTPLFSTVIPSKIFECMAMGIPVLHGVRGDSAEIIEECGAGILFEPENATELATGILELAENAPLRKRLADNAVAAAPRFDRTVLAAGMLKVLQTLKPA